MATEPSKKLDEQHKHGGGPELAAYVDLGMMSGAVLHKRHEAATGQRQQDKVVGLLSAEEVKEQERKAEAAAKDGEAASEKNKGADSTGNAEFGGDWCTSILFTCKHCCTCNLITREHSFVARRGSSIACSLLHECRRLVPDSGFPPCASPVCPRSTQLRCPSSFVRLPARIRRLSTAARRRTKLAKVFNYGLHRLVNWEFCFLDLHILGSCCRKNPSTLGG